MILSMTGYGKAEGTLGNKKFSIEIRSVNSKQFDLNVRMPGIYKEKFLFEISSLKYWFVEKSTCQFISTLTGKIQIIQSTQP